MSILLDSLTQKEKEEQPSIPDIHAEHFDDGSSLDYSQEPVNYWKAAAFFLLFLFLVGLIYYIYQSSKFHNQLLHEPHSVNNVQTEPNKVYDTNNVSSSSSLALQSNESHTSAKSKVFRTQSEANKTNVLQRHVEEKKWLERQREIQRMRSIDYSQRIAQDSISTTGLEAIQSEKREPQRVIEPPTSNSFDIANNSDIIDSSSEEVEFLDTQPSEMSKDIGLAISWEELSVEEKQRFPRLEIDSYVVSSNPNKSFIILKGRFYKINQFISADLILREITNKYVAIEFDNKLVNIPFKTKPY
jgi:hypothetical protein